MRCTKRHAPIYVLCGLGVITALAGFPCVAHAGEQTEAASATVVAATQATSSAREGVATGVEGTATHSTIGEKASSSSAAVQDKASSNTRGSTTTTTNTAATKAENAPADKPASNSTAGSSHSSADNASTTSPTGNRSHTSATAAKTEPDDSTSSTASSTASATAQPATPAAAGREATPNTASTPAATTEGKATSEGKVASEPSSSPKVVDTPSQTELTAQSSTTYSNVYRLYNSWTGEHLYTKDLEEAKANANRGWTWEGVAWVGASSGRAVYRLYNRYSGDHLYTTSKSEYDRLKGYGWTQEGTSFFAQNTDSGIAVLRLYNPYEKVGTHHYTTDTGEYDKLVREHGWRGENKAWYVSTNPANPISGFWITHSNGRRYWVDASAIAHYHLSGIDIASWQRGIDVRRLNTTDFVVVKATEGTDYVNPYYRTWADQTLDSKKKLGFYHFLRADASPSDQARYFVNAVKPYLGRAALFLDFENTTGSDVIERGADFAKEFLDSTYQLTGIRPLVYMSRNVTRELDWSSVAESGYKLWVAQYLYRYDNVRGHVQDPKLPSGSFGAWSSPTMYQYTSTGRVSGYGRDLDLDHFYGSDLDWNAMARKA